MNTSKKIAIVDYGLGNLYSVQQACKYAGLVATITSDKNIIIDANVLILPGVGAFGDAMQALKNRGLVELLRDQVKSGKILIGICLGMQLLMSESTEFGAHTGLDIVPGTTKKFEYDDDLIIKVPQIGWNHIMISDDKNRRAGSLLEGLRSDEYMYFVHSFYVEPTDPTVINSRTRYGNITYCSALQHDNIFGFQFHPERSGPAGLTIYKNLERLLNP